MTTAYLTAMGYIQVMPLDRRSFVSGQWPDGLAPGAVYLKAAESAPPLRIRRIETVYWKAREDAPFWPHWTWLKIETDAGVSGIGETIPGIPIRRRRFTVGPAC